MRRRVAAIVGLLAGLVLLVPSTARGECDGPFASFQNAAPTARRIVIGQVVASLPGPPESDGRTSRFTLQGWSVLDSDQPTVVDVRDLISQPCAGYIMARPGDRIAIAFEGHDFTPRIVVNAVAWVEGAPPPFDGIESTNVGAIYALLGRVPPVLATPATPEPPAGNPSSDGRIWLAVALLAAVVFLGTVAWRRRARR